MYHETTAFGISVNILRQMELDTPESEIRCVIQVLCRWKRGNEVIGVAKEWLDETFRSEAMNESFAVRTLVLCLFFVTFTASTAQLASPSKLSSFVFEICI